MNRKEAEDFIYKSYLKAEKFIDYSDKDSSKRHPELTKNAIISRSKAPAVLVTGSKGKGSVASMISQILSAKKRVGLMTSPHISNFCERFRINGVPISDEDFTSRVSVIESEIEEIDAGLSENEYISPMGIQAILALDYFESEHTDINIFECGKGARFDDVNNIPHEYSVINRIFLEHTRELGDTLSEIADDKSHIITEGQRCAYIAKQSPEALSVIRDRASGLGVKLKEYGKDLWAENIRSESTGMLFDVRIGKERYSDILVPLLGMHQAENAALAMAICRDIFKDFDLPYDIDLVRNALLTLKWSGRMEVLSSSPFIMLDACINRESCSAVKDVLCNLGLGDAKDSITTIIGIPDDKDYLGVAKEMSDISSQIILTRSSNPHYVFTDKQREVLFNAGIETVQTVSVEEAINLAKKQSNNIVILGTTSVVADVKRICS